MAFHRIVLMRFSSPLSSDDVAQIDSLLDDVSAQVDGFSGARFGPNAGDGNYTHGLHATFTDRAAHEGYVPHQSHKALGAFLRSKGLEYELLLLDEPAD